MATPKDPKPTHPIADPDRERPDRDPRPSEDPGRLRPEHPIEEPDREHPGTKPTPAPTTPR
jgi:hypothetical protein